MPNLASTSIARVEYDPINRALQVWFHASGAPYTYAGVPQNIYDGLISAGSHGRYFDHYIRDRYPWRRA